MEKPKKISTYRIDWKGRSLSVDARVTSDAGKVLVQIYSYREIHSGGYDDDKRGNLARGGRTDHEADEDSHMGEGDKATALAAWSPEDRAALAQVVRAAAELTDGVQA